MTEVVEIENAVKQLDPVSFKQFSAWFEQFAASNWDAQIDADAQAGKLDALAANALQNYRSGSTRAL